MPFKKGNTISKGKNNGMYGKSGPKSPTFGKLGFFAGKKRPDHSKGMKGKKNPSYIDGRSIKRTLKYKEKVAGRKKPEQCEICGAIGKIHFDHNHETGEFRGWVCMRCNLVLGMVKDNKELLIRLAKYLKQ